MKMNTTSNSMSHSMSHSMTDPKEIMIMLIIMFITGLLSSMNFWVDKVSDMRFHLNDVYMSLLMCGWSLVLMGLYYINMNLLLIGLISTFIILYCIRNQLFIDETQYLKGMIPHHSMAVLMSKKLLEKNNAELNNQKNNQKNNHILVPKIKKLVENIITSQEDEIQFMKFRLHSKDLLKKV
jgi:hypothetical protein